MRNIEIGESVEKLINASFDPGFPKGQGAFNLEPAMGSLSFFSVFLGWLAEVILVNLAIVCLLFFIQILLRNQKAAIILCCFVLILIYMPASVLSFASLFVFMAAWLFVLMRFGLIGGIFYLLVSYIVRAPITFDASAWYSGYGYAALAIFAAIVLYAFYTSLGGRPLLASSRLDD